MGRAIVRYAGSRSHREEGNQGKSKSATDEALDEYLKTLQNTFGNEERLGYIMKNVRNRVVGAYVKKTTDKKTFSLFIVGTKMGSKCILIKTFGVTLSSSTPHYA